MADEIDVWRVAQLLINQHSHDAEAAAVRFEAHCRSNEVADGEGFWRRVTAAIAELRNVNPPTTPS